MKRTTTAVAELGNKQVTRRNVTRGAAWAVPVIAASVAAPSAVASGGDWNISVTAGCFSLIGINTGAGYSICNSGSAPIPAGTVFTWTETFVITATDAITGTGMEAIWKGEDVLFGYWDKPITVSRWSTKRRQVGLFKYVITKTRTVTLIVPAGGMAPGTCLGLGYRLMLSVLGNIEGCLSFTSGNPGSVAGDESTCYKPNAILGCKGDTADPATLPDAAATEARLKALTPQQLDVFAGDAADLDFDEALAMAEAR
ncbi:hypothetical protein [Arthrobacter sp. NPDC090010]|uniref:hypothetical protein n=1 Tax=Arthrobacter sp. NPDC090010 TaxID=3363942 RepID=UPI00382046D7